MINNLSFQKSIYTAAPVNNRLISFGKEKDQKRNNKEINTETPSPLGLNTYYNIVKKIPNTTREEEQILGEKIKAGREVEDIITVLRNEEQIKNSLNYTNKVKKLINKIAPDKYDELIKMAEQETSIVAMRKHLVNGKTPTNFFNEANLQEEDIIQEQLNAEEHVPVVEIIDNLIVTLKEEHKIKQLKKRVKLYEQQGKFTEEDKKIIQAKIPSDDKNETPKWMPLPAKFRAILEESKNAKDRLVLSQLKYIPRKVKLGLERLPFEDALQEGAVMAINVAGNYDPTYGTFSAYLDKSVRAHLSTKSKQNTPLSTSIHVMNDINDYEKAKYKLGTALNRPPTEEEIEKETSFTPEKQENLKLAIIRNHPVSLSKLVNDYDEKETELEAFIRDKHTPQQDVIIEEIDLNWELMTLFKQAGISPRNAQILFLLNGEDDPSCRDLKELLNENITSNRIGQIERENLALLKKKLNEYKASLAIKPAEKRAILKTTNEILTPQEKKVLYLKCGFKHPFGNKITNEEIGELFDLPGKKIQSIYNKILRKLEKEGVTIEDIKNCREMSGVKRLHELRKLITEKKEPDLVELV